MQSTTTKSRPSGKTGPNVNMTPITAADIVDDGFAHIATAAYYRAESRGFTSGQELDDWLQAEAEFKQKGN